MGDRAQLTGLLRQAAAAMPPDERARFRRFLRGLERPDSADLIPGTPILPPVTVNAPAKRPRAQAEPLSRGPETAQQPLTRPECGWYYGERCGCGDPDMRRGHAYRTPIQLPLFGRRDD